MTPFEEKATSSNKLEETRLSTRTKDEAVRSDKKVQPADKQSSKERSLQKRVSSLRQKAESVTRGIRELEGQERTLEQDMNRTLDCYQQIDHQTIQASRSWNLFWKFVHSLQELVLRRVRRVRKQTVPARQKNTQTSSNISETTLRL